MDVQKLAKVLALAASDNDSEALHALRTARRLMEAAGLDFVDLSRRLGEGGSAGEAEAWKDAVFDLRNEVRHLRAENERLRQGRGPVDPQPAGLGDAAREEAAAIRLRAELARMGEEMELLRNENVRLKAVEFTLHQQFREALSEASRLGVKLSDLDGRRMRLEAENRRLSHANHALQVELEEARKAVQQPFTPPPEPPAPVNDKAPRRGKAKRKRGASQYALL